MWQDGELKLRFIYIKEKVHHLTKINLVDQHDSLF
jgi:hypothetical protein